MATQPPNYLDSAPNPFNLAGPPRWFQDSMRAQDPDLVIFPSQEEPVYRVARRVPHGHRSGFSLAFVRHRPDTQTFIAHGLAPITSLLPFTQWGPVVLQDLAERDIQRWGGAEAVADRLEEWESAEDRRLKKAAESEASDRAADYFRSWRYQTGQTVYQSERRGRRPETSRRQPAYRPLNFAGGSAVFVG